MNDESKIRQLRYQGDSTPGFNILDKQEKNLDVIIVHVAIVSKRNISPVAMQNHAMLKNLRPWPRSLTDERKFDVKRKTTSDDHRW